MTYAEFRAKYLGKKVDYDLAYNSQCVDLIRFYWKEVFAISQPKGVTGAKDFWTNYETDPNLKNNFDKILNTPNAVPKQGDIVIWSGSYGKYGHIAICDQADVNSLICLSQNDPLGRETHLKTYNYNFIYGWFSPKGSMDYEKLYNEARIARDNWWSNMSKLIKATGLDFTEATANAKTDEAVKRIVDTLAKLKNADARVTELTQQLNACNNNTLELNKKLATEIQTHKETYLKLQECLNKPITPPTQPSLNGRLNGYTRQYEKDGVTIVENYAIDQ